MTFMQIQAREMKSKRIAGVPFAFLLIVTAACVPSPAHTPPTLAALSATPYASLTPITPSPMPSNTSTPVPPTATLDLTALPPCDIVNAEGKLYALSTDVFFFLGPSGNEIDRALKNAFPAWAAFQQRILGYSELASVGEIIEAASLGQEKFSLNPAVALVTLGLKLDWQLPPDGDLYSQSLIVGEQLHHHWFQWNNPDNEQLRLRYPNLTEDGATYALYEFFDYDIDDLQNWCNTYQALFGSSPVQP